MHLQSIVIEIAWAAVRHDGYLKSPYRRHIARNGGYRSKAAKNKAIFTVAHAIIAIFTVAHAIIVIIWNVLSTGTPYEDLGAACVAVGNTPLKTYHEPPADGSAAACCRAPSGDPVFVILGPGRNY